jgi:methyl-accepting chemotaxis protein
VVLAGEKTDVEEKNALSIIDGRTNLLLVWAFFGVVGSLTAGYLLTRYINGTINTYLSFAGRVARGDLTMRLEPKNHDELAALGRHLDGMVQNLSEMAGEIHRSAREIASAVTEILVIVGQLASNTSKTSSAVTETTTTVEQVKQAAKMVSERAKQTAEASTRAVEISEAGNKATEDTIQRINMIKEQMESIGETVVRLSEHTKAIENIIATVQDLADQSNLLAVNASIEAARAGEQGKGFAVVANEIKNLADQSKQATEQVRSILAETGKWVSAVVMATEQGAKAVEVGVSQSSLAGDSIQSLAESVAAYSQTASIIHASSEQQFAGVDQVAAAMGNIDTAMRQTVSGADQLGTAGKKLEELGATLNGLVARYKV